MGLEDIAISSHQINISIKTSTAPEGQMEEQGICLKGVGQGASHLMGSPPDSNRRSTFSTSDDEYEERTMSHSQHPAAPGLQLQELIGRGAFGSVHRAVWRGMQVAVKVWLA